MQRTPHGGLKEILYFLGSVFTDFNIPKERLYLYHYFRKDIARAFLKYYYCLGDLDYFTDRTGIWCQVGYLKFLKQKHDRIVAVHDQAKRDMDLTLLAAIERGKKRRI